MNEGADKIVNSVGLDSAASAKTIAGGNARHIVIALAAYQPDAGYFREQLASIDAQTYSNWSCVITLDSPIDQLRSLPELAGCFRDERFVWIENPIRLGHKKNFERAIEIAASRGAWAIATCDQDDVWSESKLDVLARELERLPALSLVHSDMSVLKDNAMTDESVWQRTRQGVDDSTTGDLLVANVVTGCSMLFDASLARRYPTIPDSYDYHDHWYAVAASCHGGVHPVRMKLVAYRQHARNVVGATSFDWGVSLPEVGETRDLFDAMRERWQVVRRRTIDALAAGMPLKRGVVRRYRDGRDLGVVTFFRGAILSLSNPRLSRYLIRTAIGRVLQLFTGRTDEVKRPVR